MLTMKGTLSHSALIDTIQVVDHSGPVSIFGTGTRDIYDLKDVLLDVQAYELRDNDTEMLAAEQQNEEEEESPQARVTLLPNKGLDGLWDAYVNADFMKTNLLICDRLIFDVDIPARLLRFLTKMSM